MHNKRNLIFFIILGVLLAARHYVAASSEAIFVRRAQTSDASETGEDSGEGIVPEYQQEIRGGFDVTDIIPWYVVFDDTTICGGALIYGDIVMTAAHCLAGDRPKAVRVGTLNYKEGGTVANVDKVALHPGWNGDITKGSDVAVIKIDTWLSNEVATVNSDGSIPSSGNKLFIAGFGLVDNDNLSKTLQGVFLDFVDQCGKRESSYNAKFHICGDASSNKGTCAGDSGSPVVLDGSKTVVGLNSYSDGGCESQTIDVYTRVSTYAEWVGLQVCLLSDSPPSDCASTIASSGCWGLLKSLAGLFGY